MYLVGSQKNNNVSIATHDKCMHAEVMPSWTKLFKDAYINEARDFIRCIREDDTPRVSGHDGKMALILVREGLRSLLEKRPIRIGE